MKVLHVAPYWSQGGSYGGPMTVAVNQVRALQEAGHDVQLAAGWDAVARPPADTRSVLLRAYRPSSQSFAGLTSPALVCWINKHAHKYDVVHVHLARDLTTLPAARLAAEHAPVFLQTHGMVTSTANVAQRLLDRALTASVLSAARRVFVLTALEREEISGLGVPPVKIATVPNGVPESVLRARWRKRAPIVLFASRLAARKRPLAVAEAARLVLQRRADVQFRVVGSDEGQLGPLAAFIREHGLEGNVQYFGSASHQEVLQHMAEASIFVLPSFAEPFPMALLEAMSVGLPSIITGDTGISALSSKVGSALVFDGSVDSLASNILHLVDDEAAWSSVSAAAVALCDRQFSMRSVAERLVRHYQAPEDD